MCGGLMMAVGMQLPQPKWLYLLTYNLGRISSYALAGALVGSLGQASSVLEFILPIQQILFLLSSLMLLLLGLYIANLWHGLLLIEKLGGRLWVRVEPWARKLLPIQHLPQAFFAGMLWGWLPCGLVYSVLIGALASGSAQNGAIMMLMFGLGTLPMLISLGFASAKLKPVLQSERLRMICGGMIAMFGIMGLYRLFW